MTNVLYIQEFFSVVDGSLSERARAHHLCQLGDALVGGEGTDVTDGGVGSVLLVYLVVGCGLGGNLRQVGNADDLTAMASDAEI